MSDRPPDTLTTGPGLEPDDLGPMIRPAPAARHSFDTATLAREDFNTAIQVLTPGGLRGKAGFDWALDRLYRPDAVVSTDDGDPIMYRWHLVPRNDFGNVYFHIQVRDDGTGRGPHDHMYDSQATILAGAYVDQCFQVKTIYDPHRPGGGYKELRLIAEPIYSKGEIVRRTAADLHLIKLVYGCPYTMTIFSTGPRYRGWGFVDPDGTWHPAEAKGDIVNGVVVAKGRAAT